METTQTNESTGKKVAQVAAVAVGVAVIAGIVYWGLRYVTSEETAATVADAVVGDTPVA